MSRHITLDFEFDKDKYMALIKKAQGERQQKQFAQDIGMSKSYLNNFLTGKNDQPFMPSVLRKIAAASEGRVSFKELLEAAGYDYRKHMKISDLEYNRPNPIKSYENKSEELDKKVSALKGILSAALANKGYKWSGVQDNDEKSYFGLRVNIYELSISEWEFFFLIDDNPNLYFTTSYTSETDNMSSLAQRLLFSMNKPKEKISFVALNRETFDKFCEYSIPVLGLYVSVILVDVEKYTIVDEKYIETMLKPDESIPTLI